jgi:hypothetical protein
MIYKLSKSFILKFIIFEFIFIFSYTNNKNDKKMSQKIISYFFLSFLFDALKNN